MSEVQVAPDAAKPNHYGEKLWFGHPPQLAWLFSTELWERFGYYGMRALLAIYLAGWFFFDDATVGGLYGAFASLVYLTPLFGGMIADRVLGSKFSVKIGAILMALGYTGLALGGQQAKPTFEYQNQTYAVQVIESGKDRQQQVIAPGGAYTIRGNEDGSLTLEGATGTDLPASLPKGSYKFGAERDPVSVALLLLSLSLVIVGNGLFKPNISTMVGSLYTQGDRRRDSGFTIFYLGINLGSVFSQAIAPVLAVALGWWAGFGLVAVGMTISWLMMHFDGGRLTGYGEPPEGIAHKTKLLIYVAILVAIPVAWLLLDNTVLTAAAAQAAAKAGDGVFGYLASLPILGKAMIFAFVISIIGIPLWALRAGSRDQFEKMLAAIILVVFSVVFWTLFELAGSALTLFAERSTDRHLIGGYEMPGGQVQIFNPIFIVMLAPVFAALWLKLGAKGREPSIPVKFAIGLILVGAGYLVVVLGSQFADSQFRVALIWVALLYLLHSVGELCLSPVGLSMITKLSMAKVVGLMMGTWFLGISMAQYVGGIITQFASVETVGGAVTNPKVALETYVGVFQTIGSTAVIFGVLLLLVSPLIKRIMHGVQ